DVLDLAVEGEGEVPAGPPGPPQGVRAGQRPQPLDLGGQRAGDVLGGQHGGEESHGSSFAGGPGPDGFMGPWWGSRGGSGSATAPRRVGVGGQGSGRPSGRRRVLSRSRGREGRPRVARGGGLRGGTRPGVAPRTPSR